MDKPSKPDSRASGRSGKLSVPGYDIITRVGKGAMGVVYKANQRSLNRVVALKVLSSKLASDGEFIERFVREAKSVARLRHENIISGIDVGSASGAYYFVMEFVDGETVYQKLQKDGRMNVPWAASVILQIARALEHAHRNRIIHRDVKPDNMMIDADGTAKLCDLGLAKELTTEIAATGKAEGTPHYISPEQALGEGDVDSRTDIYSLGASFYHMLTGETPFKGENAREIMQKHLHDEPAPVEELCPGLPAGYAAVIRKMMARKPADRYADVSEVIGDLERLEQGRAPLLGGKEREGGGVISPPVLIGAAAAAVMVILALVLVLGGGGDGETGALLTIQTGLPPMPEKKTAPATPEKKPVVGKEEKPEPKPEKKPERSAREIEAEEALAKATALVGAEPVDYAAVIGAYEEVIKKYGDTEIADRAKGELEIFKRELEKKAGLTFSETMKSVEDNLKRRRFGLAMGLAEVMEKAYPGTKYAKKAEEIRKYVGEAHGRYLQEAAREFAKLLEEWKLNRAEDLLKTLRSRCLESAGGEIDKLEEKLDTAKKQQAAYAAYQKFQKDFWAAIVMGDLAGAGFAASNALHDESLASYREHMKLVVDDVALMKKAMNRVVDYIGGSPARRDFLFLDGTEATLRVKEIRDGKVTFKPAGDEDEGSERLLRELDLANLVDLETGRWNSGDADEAEKLYENGLLLSIFGYLDEARESFAEAERKGRTIPEHVKKRMKTLEPLAAGVRARTLESLSEDLFKAGDFERCARYVETLLTIYRGEEYVKSRRKKLVDFYVKALSEDCRVRGLEVFMRGKIRKDEKTGIVQLEYDFEEEGQAGDWYHDEKFDKRSYLKEHKGRLELGGRLVLEPVWEGDIKVEYTVIPCDKDAMNLNLCIADKARRGGWMFCLGLATRRYDRNLKVNPPRSKKYPCPQPCEAIFRYKEDLEPTRIFFGARSVKARTNSYYKCTAVHTGDRLIFSVGSKKLADFREDHKHDESGRVCFVTFGSRIYVKEVKVTGKVEDKWLKNAIDNYIKAKVRELEQVKGK